MDIYLVSYYSAIKKNEIMPFAAWMDLEILILSEISQTEKDKCHRMSLTGGNVKNDANEFISKIVLQT